MHETLKINIFLLEEIESNLHPKWQKLIPKILYEFNLSFPNIQFIISTHSPFIISAAAEFGNSQKVYLIEKGQTKDAETRKLNTILSQKGYHGNEVKEVVNEMLGISNTDFLPANIVFCDQSLEVFLKLIYKNFYFDNKDLSFRVPTHPSNKEKLGGDSSLLSLVNVQDLLLQGQNILMTNFFVIMDKVKNEPKTEGDFKKQEALQERYKNLIILEAFSFEEKFGQDPSTFKGVQKKLKNAKFQAEELIKMKENGKKEFKKIFPELKLIFDK